MEGENKQLDGEAKIDDVQEQMIKDGGDVESVNEMIDKQFNKYLEEKKEAL